MGGWSGGEWMIVLAQLGWVLCLAISHDTSPLGIDDRSLLILVNDRLATIEMLIMIIMNTMHSRLVLSSTMLPY